MIHRSSKILTADRLAAEVAGLFGDEDLARLSPALRRPGPQQCNQIPLTYTASIAGLTATRPRWPHFRLWLRIARMLRRWIKLAVADAILRQRRAI
jgi:hypothetical protein